LGLHGPIGGKDRLPGIAQAMKMAGVMGYSRKLLGHGLLDALLGIAHDPPHREPPTLHRR